MVCGACAHAGSLTVLHTTCRQLSSQLPLTPAILDATKSCTYDVDASSQLCSGTSTHGLHGKGPSLLVFAVQSLIQNALTSAAVGRLIFFRALTECKDNATFTTRAGNVIDINQAKLNTAGLIMEHLRTRMREVGDQRASSSVLTPSGAGSIALSSCGMTMREQQWRMSTNANRGPC